MDESKKIECTECHFRYIYPPQTKCNECRVTKALETIANHMKGVV